MRLSILRSKKKKANTNEKNNKPLPNKRAFRLAVSGPGRFALKKKEEFHPKYLMDEELEAEELEKKSQRRSRKSRKRDEISKLPHSKRRR